MAGQVISKVAAGGGTHLVSTSTFLTCATPAGDAAKIANFSDTNINAFVPIAGTIIYVKFTNTNLYNGNVTLTIQTSSGTQILAAKNIYTSGTTSVGITEGTSWKAGSVVPFVYDGANWFMLGKTESEEEIIISVAENSNPPADAANKKIWIEI